MPEAPRIRRQTMIHLEPAEVLSVLRAAKANGAREWAMILLAYKHAMRASEVCNLRLDDIDLKNGSIVVDRLKGSASWATMQTYLLRTSCEFCGQVFRRRS